MTAQARALPNRHHPLPSLYLQASVTVLLAGWADWLFYGHGVGVSFAIFAVILAGTVLLLGNARSTMRERISALSVLGLSLLPGLESFNYLSALFGLMGIIAFILILHRQWRPSLAASLMAAGTFVMQLPWRLPFDIAGFSKAVRRHRIAIKDRLGVTVWIVPIGFSLIFLVLFSSANPLIEKWLTEIDLLWPLYAVNVPRVLFWVAVLLMCWPLVRFKTVRTLAWRPLQKDRPRNADVQNHGGLFGEPAVFRALLMFNLLFALQIVLDVTYLFGGAALPEGMTYAQYAHRGAYPLICTALLAAGFVLFATRPGAASQHSARVRILILVWTGQNVALVLFSIHRLGLYVEAYALTYWRIAAFIWMLLVVAGLVLIVLKLVRGKSNMWLIDANLITALVVLYVTSFVNVASVIAEYNVTRSIGADKPRLDTIYLRQLGAAAIPEIDRANAMRQSIRLAATTRGSGSTALARLMFARNRLAAKAMAQSHEWRLWSFRRDRLQRYLDTAGLARVPNVVTDKDDAP